MFGEVETFEFGEVETCEFGEVKEGQMQSCGKEKTQNVEVWMTRENMCMTTIQSKTE